MKWSFATPMPLPLQSRNKQGASGQYGDLRRGGFRQSVMGDNSSLCASAPHPRSNPIWRQAGDQLRETTKDFRMATIALTIATDS